MYVWDATAKQTRTLLTTNKIRLSPDSWLDNKVLKISGEDLASKKYLPIIYEYDVTNVLLLFSGTATPRP
jgi:hypothetical protein